GVERHATERAKDFLGAARWSHVDLGDLCARSRPGVREVEFYAKRAARWDRTRGDYQLFVLKLGVGQAVAEGKGRLVREVHVRAPFADVVVLHRGKIGERGIEGDR